MREFIYPITTTHIDTEFDKFKVKHNKKYESKKEVLLRKEVFRQNIRYIHSVNRQHKGSKQYFF